MVHAVIALNTSANNLIFFILYIVLLNNLI